MKTKHAVLYSPDRVSSSLLWIEGQSIGGKEVLPEPCHTLRDLAEVAYPRFITHLWVHPGYGTFAESKGADGWNFSSYQNRKQEMMGIAVRKRGHQQKDMDIIFPQHTSWWGSENAPGWMHGADAHEIAITLHYLELALGIVVGSSPARTGWNYLKTLHPEWIEELTGVNLKACHFTKDAALDIIWDRPLLTIELLKKYVHKFDKNAEYPYASSQTPIGVGVPVHVDHGHDAVHEKGHPQEVGVWRCTITYWCGYDAMMPPVWKEDRQNHKSTEGWLSGPIIRLLRSQGHEVTIHEGWVFPEKHDVMVQWARNMWDIRQGFASPGKWKNTVCAQLAGRAIKQIVNSMIGMTAFGGFEDDDSMKRPDIRLQVIGRHRELIWHNINKIKTLYDVTPIMVYMDAVYYLSDNPDGRAAFPELVKRETQLGGFKWEGRISMSDASPHLEKRISEGGKLEELNKIGWVK